MEKETIRICKQHGETNFILEGRGYYRCKQCRSAAVTRKRKKLKLDAVRNKGGKCQQCGYDRCVDALDFHHMSKKEFGIAAHGYTRSWEKLKKEIEKCILLCANCHREIHSENFAPR